MSFEEINFLHRNPNMSKDEVAQLMTMLQGIQPRVDDSASQELIVYNDEIRIRDSVETVNPGFPDTNKTETRKRTSTGGTTGTMFRRRMPSTVNSYPLIHHSVGAGAFSFPAEDGKFGGRADCNGTRAIIIDDHARLKPTDKISYVEQLWLPATEAGDPDRYIIDKETYYVRVNAHATASNQIQVGVKVGGIFYTLTYTFTPSAWFHLGFTWKSPNLKLYVNGSLDSSRTDATGTLDTSTKPLGIGTTNTGAYLSSGYVSSGYVT